MPAVLSVLYILLLAIVFFLAFLLLGTIRGLATLRWKLEQLEATTPSRIGRNGLKPGRRAIDFTLPSANGGDVGLHDFAGRKVLLVFTQSGCGPCHEILPELNRLDTTKLQVVVVNNGELEATRKWSEEAQVKFPMLVQERFSLSRQYEVFATPFAFLIDEKRVIASQGIITNKQYIRFVLEGKPESKQLNGEVNESEDAHSVLSQKGVKP